MEAVLSLRRFDWSRLEPLRWWPTSLCKPALECDILMSPSQIRRQARHWRDRATPPRWRRREWQRGEKRAHYRAALAHRGLAPSAFIPFVVEATGRLGEAATTFVEQVVTYPDIQATDAAGTVRFGMARLQTLIARGNAIAIKAFARGARAIG